jgi:hypothetical protein
MSRFLIRALQMAIQARAADAQQLRGAHAIAFTGFQDALDVRAANFRERQRTPGLVLNLRVAIAFLDMFGQIGDVNEIGGGGDGGAGEYVFEFADIAGPIVLQ